MAATADEFCAAANSYPIGQGCGPSLQLDTIEHPAKKGSYSAEPSQTCSSICHAAAEAPNLRLQGPAATQQLRPEQLQPLQLEAVQQSYTSVHDVPQDPQLLLSDRHDAAADELTQAYLGNRRAGSLVVDIVSQLNSSNGSVASCSQQRHRRPITAVSSPNRCYNTPSTAKMLLRPLSPQLRTLSHKTGSSSATVVEQSRSFARPQSPPKVKRYTPGPGTYSPAAARRSMDSFAGIGPGTFTSAAKDSGTYLTAYTKTGNSPGPAYYPRPGSSSSRARTSSSNHSSPSSSIQAVHSMAGSWAKAEVGSRGILLVHRCGFHAASPSSSSSSAKAAAACAATDCPACAAARPHSPQSPGPGSYDIAVGKDGRGVLLTQSCPAFSVPKSVRLRQGRNSPYISSQHAGHENQGCCSPGPMYKADISPTRPSSCSPTIRRKGQTHWDEVIKSSRCSSSGKQLLGHSPVSRQGRHLLGEGPRTQFGKSSLDTWTSVKGYQDYVLNWGKHGVPAWYQPKHSQVDKHMAVPSFMSGPVDRFDDKWLPGSGRL